MQNLFLDVSPLDQRAVSDFGLSEELMMEHAALAMAQTIGNRFAVGSSILIVCGNGNNGADGLALARLLMDRYTITVHLPFGVRAPLAQRQYHRLTLLHVEPKPIESGYDLIVDALFGSGLNRPLNDEVQTLIHRLNGLSGVKMACDVPSGLFSTGTLHPITFCAEITVTMGGLKRSLYSDPAKGYVGEIVVGNLGLPREVYEIDSPWKSLDPTDMKLPVRTKVSTHKGSYGHLALITGEHVGACVLAASAALRFGAGLVTLIAPKALSLPYELMSAQTLRPTTSAIALGMGLGVAFDDAHLHAYLDHTHPMVLDADIFYHPLCKELLHRPHLVITPHPKEFTQILRLSGIANIDVETLQHNRFAYVERFCAAYPHVTLLLKGANVIIGLDTRFFVNPHGTVALAKGGSGDVLCGLIGALLAQGYPPLEAAIQGSLAHTLSAKAFAKHNYALTPLDIIEGITTL